MNSTTKTQVNGTTNGTSNANSLSEHKNVLANDIRVRMCKWRGPQSADKVLCRQFVKLVESGTVTDAAYADAVQAFERVKSCSQSTIVQIVPSATSLSRSETDALLDLLTAFEGNVKAFDATLRSVRSLILVRMAALEHVPSATTPDAVDHVETQVAASEEVPEAPLTVASVLEPQRPVNEQDASSEVCGGEASAIEAVVADILKQVAEEDWEGMPLPRLRWAAEATAAEARLWGHRLPEASVARRELDDLFRKITAIVRARRPGFVRGLRRNEVLDWQRIVDTARGRVAQFDADTSVGIAPPKMPATRPSRSTPENEEAPEAPMARSTLATIAASRTVAVVGGNSEPEWLTQFGRDLGVCFEWSPGELTGPRNYQQLSQRIMAGSVAAVFFVRRSSRTRRADSCGPLVAPREYLSRRSGRRGRANSAMRSAASKRA